MSLCPHCHNLLDFPVEIPEVSKLHTLNEWLLSQLDLIKLEYEDLNLAGYGDSILFLELSVIERQFQKIANFLNYGVPLER